jgi:hypothetical protein
MKMKSLSTRRFFVHFASFCAMFSATLALKAATFNVKDYGAIGDDKTDNTAAFSKCMEAIIAAGGGQMFLPDGVYRGRIITPANNNAALTLLRNVTVTGYDTGIVVHEHTHGDHIVLGSNIHGLKFVRANHASRFDRVSAMRNTHHITVFGQHGFSIAQLNVENSGPGQTDGNNEWQKIATDINDAENLGIGDVNWWVVRGNVGAVDEFKVAGGKGIRSRRISAQNAFTP